MNIKSILATAAIILVSIQSIAQVHRCGTVEAMQSRDHQYPGFLEAVNNTFDQAKLTSNRGAAAPPVYQIPVVVHVLYNTPEENLPWEVIISQIDRLNKDYRRLNADTTDTRSEFLPVAADIEIEFYLAGEAPNGDPSGGITRTETSRSDFAINPFGGAMDEMKQSANGGKDAWDTQRYLNIWVCDLIGDNPTFPVLGFAYPPASAPNWPANSAAPSSELEGVVVHYEVFGSENPLAVGEWSIADMGRTAVHEVGHYLGLRHIWGDAFFGDGCAEDDGLEDTPNAAASAGQTCVLTANSCTDAPVDHPDMIENYMDYALESCMNLFTQDQADIMRAMLEGPRSGLLENQPPPTGIFDDSISALSLYPNPSKGLVRINSKNWNSEAQISVYDVFGRVVLTTSIQSIKNNVIDFSGLDSGNYLIRVFGGQTELANGRVLIID